MIQVKTTARETEILIELKIASYLYAVNKVDFGNEWSCTFFFFLLLFSWLHRGMLIKILRFVDF